MYDRPMEIVVPFGAIWRPPPGPPAKFEALPPQPPPPNVTA